MSARVQNARDPTEAGRGVGGGCGRRLPRESPQGQQDTRAEGHCRGCGLCPQGNPGNQACLCRSPTGLAPSPRESRELSQQPWGGQTTGQDQDQHQAHLVGWQHSLAHRVGASDGCPRLSHPATCPGTATGSEAAPDCQPVPRSCCVLEPPEEGRARALGGLSAAPDPCQPDCTSPRAALPTGVHTATWLGAPPSAALPRTTCLCQACHQAPMARGHSDVPRQRGTLTCWGHRQKPGTETAQVPRHDEDLREPLVCLHRSMACAPMFP